MRRTLIATGAIASVVVAVGVVLSLLGATPSSVLLDGGHADEAHAQSTASTQAQAEVLGREALQAELDRIADSRGAGSLPYAETAGRAVTAGDFVLGSPSYHAAPSAGESLSTTMGAVQPPASLSSGVWDFHYVAANVAVPDPKVLQLPIATIDADVTIADGTGKVVGVTIEMHEPG